jgi:hypothetical protein
MSAIYLVIRENVHPPYREEIEAAYVDRAEAQEYRERCDDEEHDMEPHREARFYVRALYVRGLETLASAKEDSK